MTIRIRTLFFLALGIFVFWFLTAAYGILTPFILAAIFAYIFNPIVNFFSNHIRLPRTIAVIVVYLIIIFILCFIGILLTQRVVAESFAIHDYVTDLLRTTRTQINGIPDWLKPTVYDLLFSLRKATTMSGSFSLAPFFPKAISELTNFVIFIFSSIYFLKDGDKFLERILAYVPNDLKLDVEILLRKVNSVLGSYLRGQMFLVMLMTIWTFLALLTLGVRFSLLIAIFSGFAEIVPIIGPIVAATVACIVVLITGSVNFGLSPFNAALIVIAIYFVLRHLEDYFVIPQVMGKITKLPPFVIFFSVIAGGHMMGILGLILAVPTAATIRILLEFSMDQINGRKHIAREANKPDSVSSPKK